MDLKDTQFEALAPESEPGMNLISADFDLVMVNRANERLYGKSMVALLGKKCYREFEKREEPCPHCPGRLALATGEAHEAETIGIRDDGTRFAARVRVHPVYGPSGEPAGFIEMVEDITERKRAQNLARIDSDLQIALASAGNTRKAVRETLEAALQLEAVDCGCAFLSDPATGEQILVLQRNLSAECVETFARMDLTAGSRSSELAAAIAGIPGVPRAYEIVPITHRGHRVAALVLGASDYPDLPLTIRAALQDLGTAAGSAVSRILAEQSRGDAVADLETFINMAPVAAWILDTDGRVTMWNRAAERLFGWKGTETLGRRPPVYPPDWKDDESPTSGPATREAMLSRKDGTLVEVRLVTAPFRDIIGDASSTIVMAEDLTPQRRLAEPVAGSGTVAETVGSTPKDPHCRSGPNPLPRVLLVDPDAARCSQLAELVSSLGYAPARSDSSAQGASHALAAEAEGRPFVAAIVELIGQGGPAGLDLQARLRSVAIDLPLVVCSDSDVVGYQQHGFAAALKRPYAAGAVGAALGTALAALAAPETPEVPDLA